ncbi:MAG: sugar phosphate isomerase/epimerase [Armatimonadota bacterium]|nr:sugar phosphate isomerase/epimerase [Armatimonadota bacterium]
MANIPVALQMYTLRNEANADYLGVLKSVAEMGYAGVELAGMPIPAKDIRKALDGLSLVAPSMHVGYNDLVNDVQRLIVEGREIGVSYITCSGIFNDLRKSAEGYKTAAEALSLAGEQCVKQGLELCYHNHAFEFDKFDGKCGYDILFENSAPRYLKAQIDTYWVQFAGEDPAAYIRRYAGRCPLVHLKDMAKDEERAFEVIGNGILDFNAIFKASEAAGVTWYIVEQDICKGNPLECVRESLDNLKRMGI